MGRPYLCGLSLVMMMTVAIAHASARDDVREEHVVFEPGTSETTVTGAITGYEVVDYLVGARAGQTMTVKMITEHGFAFFNVIPPDSESEAVYIGSTAVDPFTGRLDLDGDWRIRVYLMRSAARRGEVARFTLDVAVGGSADPAAAREPNDFGPREWDARGALGCAFGGEPMRPARCPFKVVRNPYGGTVFVERPDDGSIRILYFENGEWSADSEMFVATTRRADMWTVTVAEQESFEIPEAVITGG